MLKRQERLSCLTCYCLHPIPYMPYSGRKVYRGHLRRS
jgi:hypothetical protein